MKTYAFTFSGTEEHLLAGAVENGYTGFKPVVMPDILHTTELVDGLPVIVSVPTPEPEEETIDEFMCRILMSISPDDFIKIATAGLQLKKGTENYDAQAMTESMINLISISPFIE